MFYENLLNGNNLSFVLGVNVLDDFGLVKEVATEIKNIVNKYNVNVIFKASWDKANRSSIHSFRGLGLTESLKIFSKLKDDFEFELLTDVHEIGQASYLSSVIDVFQLPAFLSRQTDLVIDIAKVGLPVNIKKAQFLAPDQMKHVVNKFIESGNNKLMICERGHCFGYNNLVVDFLGIDFLLKTLDIPVVLDVTHSLQIRESGDLASGGRSEQARALALAGVAIGVKCLFLETHPNPEYAKCDGPSATKLADLDCLIKDSIKIFNCI